MMHQIQTMLVMSRKSCDLQMPKVQEDGCQDEKTRNAKQGFDVSDACNMDIWLECVEQT